jgi:hypothetical protein
MDIFMAVNSNKFVAGFAMIAMNFGSRYILGDLSKAQDSLLQSQLAKQLVMLCIFFVSTRDILVSFMLLFAFQFIVFGVFNETKPFNAISSAPTYDQNKDSYDIFVKNIQLYTRT